MDCVTDGCVSVKNNASMNKVWTLYGVCTWNYISMMMDDGIGVVWGHEGFERNLAEPRLARTAWRQYKCTMLVGLKDVGIFNLVTWWVRNIIYY